MLKVLAVKLHSAAPWAPLHPAALFLLAASLALAAAVQLRVCAYWRAARRLRLPTAVRHASHAQAAQQDARHDAAHMAAALLFSGGDQAGA